MRNWKYASDGLSSNIAVWKCHGNSILRVWGSEQDLPAPLDLFWYLLNCCSYANKQLYQFLSYWLITLKEAEIK